MQYRRMRQAIKSKKGMTLLELMVSFTLLLILMTVTVSTIMPAARTFKSVISVSRAQSVSNLLVDKISGELSSAKGNIKINPNRKSIEYADQKGNIVTMSADDSGKLILDYKSEGTKWYFTENVYLGCKIAPKDGLEFSTIDTSSSTGKNLVKFKLKILYGESGREYERSVVVDCYNSTTKIE